MTAHVEGRGAGTDNLDMKGAALLPFWQGVAASAPATFDVRR